MLDNPQNAMVQYVFSVNAQPVADFAHGCP
jgi:hypothetical protein